jgi:hypothetical protein
MAVPVSGVPDAGGSGESTLAKIVTLPLAGDSAGVVAVAKGCYSRKGLLTRSSVWDSFDEALSVDEGWDGYPLGWLSGVEPLPRGLPNH